MALFTEPDGAPNRYSSYVGFSDFFAAYEKDFCRLTQAVTRSLAEAEWHLNRGASPTEMSTRQNLVQGLLSESQTKLREADTCLRQMELEVQSLPNSCSQATLVADYRQDFRNLSTSLGRLEQNLHHTAVTAAALPLSSQSESGYQTNARQRMLDTTMSLHASTRALEDSRRLAVETEDLGLNIMGELRGQRDTVIRSTQMASNAGANVSDSSRLITRMRRRNIFNKVLLYAAIALISVSIILLLYMKLTSHR